MTQLDSKHTPHRGKLFPERTISDEEKAKHQLEIEVFYQRCRPIFERLRPLLIEKHKNWFIVIEPESEEYFLDKERAIAFPSLLKYKFICVHLLQAAVNYFLLYLNLTSNRIVGFRSSTQPTCITQHLIELLGFVPW
ncbi:hypothetical protein [Scytonema sp. NUACC26]|uniref:hypothetical protein n=1 Tax=Scytonema sp. NUACC26 TaxID=3140176 RepID=UPI0034DBABA0